MDTSQIAPPSGFAFDDNPPPGFVVGSSPEGNLQKANDLVPLNEAVSWRQGKPPSLWERFTSIFAGDAAKEAAKASNALAYSEMFGIAPSAAYQYHDDISRQVRDKLSTEKIVTEPHGLMETARAGFDTSVMGLLKNQKAPAPFEPFNLTEELVHSWTQLGADLPLMVVGYALGGGNPIGGTAGAFALPQGLRKMLIDRYQKGEVQSFGDFMDRTLGAIKETVKGQIVGGLTGIAGEVSPVGWKAMNEIGTMSAAGKLIEGEIPTAKDFVLAAGTVGGLHVAGAGAGVARERIADLRNKLENFYSEYGVRPDEAARELNYRIPGNELENPTPETINKAFADLEAEIRPQAAIEATALDAGMAKPKETGVETGTPAPETEIVKPGAVKEAAPEESRPIKDILADINDAFGETGAIGKVEMTEKQRAAKERIDNDLNVLKIKARQAGQKPEDYLKTAGFDDATIAKITKYAAAAGEQKQRELPQQIFTEAAPGSTGTPGGEPPKGANPADYLRNAYEWFKDIWIGHKDVEKLKANVEASNLQQEILEALGKKKYNQAVEELGKDITVQDVDKAIQIYIDTKRDPSAIDTYYKDLKPEQQKIVDLSQNLPPEIRAIADKITESYRDIGRASLDAGLIKNIIDNYAARVWNLEDKAIGIESKRKFGTKTGHAKQRTFDTIIEGWANGYDLKVEGATENLRVLREEITRTLANRSFIEAALKAKDIEGNSLLSTKHLDNYKEIENPNFYGWRFATAVELDTSNVDKATGLKVGDFVKAKDQGNLGRVTDITNNNVDVNFKNKEKGTEATVSYLVKDGSLEKDTLQKVQHGGKNFVILDDGTVLEKQRLYAPEKIADDLNNILGTSLLNKVPGVHTITKYNAIFKSWILQSSFFHHLAFTRNYYLGTPKEWTDWSIRDAYKEGAEKIRNLEPDVMTGVRNGLTLKIRQDWEENLLQEKTIIGKILDQTEITKDVKDKLLELREIQANWLFNEFGAGLKAKSYLLEMQRLLKDQPTEDPDVLSKRAAELTNENYGGLHLERMGRNPTLQHIFRLFCLAPDWTESNIRLTSKALQGIATGSPAELALYQRLVANWMIKGIGITAIGNFMLAGGDVDEMIKNYEKAWEAGNFKWMQLDITPIYQAFGGDTSRHKYFSVIGHMLDPLKMIADPVKFAHRKGSVVYKTGHEAVTGANWAGKRYATLGELLDENKLVKWGPGHPVSYSTFPAYALTQIIGTEPVQLQNLIGWVSGETEGFDSIANSLGLGVTSTYEKK